MKTQTGFITVLCVMGLLVFSRATETNLIPWHVVSSNRLTEIRQEFYALPRPVIEGWQTVTQRGPVMFFGWSAEMEGTKLVLTTNATAFIRDNVAQGTNEIRDEVELAGALWPMLLDTNHSVEATAILIGNGLEVYQSYGRPVQQQAGHIRGRGHDRTIRPAGIEQG
jgi:hypothetical protein